MTGRKGGGGRERVHVKGEGGQGRTDEGWGWVGLGGGLSFSIDCMTVWPSPAQHSKRLNNCTAPNYYTLFNAADEAKVEKLINM